MLYCEKCHTLSKEIICSKCGNNELREPNAEDFCFLVCVNDYLGKMFIQSCKNEGIELTYKPVGNGVRSYWALSLGNYELYVQYAHYNKAISIYDFFTQNYSTNKLQEKILNNIDLWHFDNLKVEKKIRKKLKIAQDVNLIQVIKETVEKAQSINDAGLMLNNEHGLVVKNDKITLWFSSESFKINL